MEDIFGPDTRVPLKEYGISTRAIGRVRGGTTLGRDGRCATAFLISGGLMLTNEHVEANQLPYKPGLQNAEYRLTYIDFHVPLSDQQGFPNLPDMKNVFQVKRKTNSHGQQIPDLENPVTGGKSQTEDWCVFKLEKNGTTGLSVLETQQSFFRLTNDFDFNADKTPLVRIAGYGRYWNEKVTQNIANPIFFPRGSTLQNSQGTIDDELEPNPSKTTPSNMLKYKISTYHGNSGSPVYIKSSLLIVGVHRGTLIKDRLNNYAIGIKNPNLVSAIEQFLGTKKFLDPDHPGKKEDGTILAPYKTIQTALANLQTNEILGIVSPTSCYYYGEIEFGLGTAIKIIGEGPCIFAPGGVK